MLGGPALDTVPDVVQGVGELVTCGESLKRSSIPCRQERASGIRRGATRAPAFFQQEELEPPELKVTDP